MLTPSPFFIPHLMSPNPAYTPDAYTGHVRLPRHHYRAGCFFITICTYGKYPWFGHIRNGIMGLSDAGFIVADEWTKTPHLRSHVELDEWIIMPNHMHGIIRLHENNAPLTTSVQPTRRDGSSNTTNADEHILHPAPGSLAIIMNQFKSTCTRRIRASRHPDFQWQPRFHDRIIRNDNELMRIRRYIRDNPATWYAKHAGDVSEG